MRDVDVDKVVQYAGEDADITLQLKKAFEPLIKEIRFKICSTM
jgi:DNA polymerase-1